MRSNGGPRSSSRCACGGATSPRPRPWRRSTLLSIRRSIANRSSIWQPVPTCASSATCCSVARPASANSPQETAPLGHVASSTETVDVIDPTHPLYGLTLPLLRIVNSRRLGRTGIVQIAPGVERMIPLAATNLASVVAPPCPCRLSVPAIQALLSVVASLADSAPEDVHAPGADPRPRDGRRSPARPSPGHPHRSGAPQPANLDPSPAGLGLAPAAGAGASARSLPSRCPGGD